MIQFTLYQKGCDLDPGDCFVDPNAVTLVILGEDDTGMKFAKIYGWGDVSATVHDPHRQVAKLIAERRGDMIIDGDAEQ